MFKSVVLDFLINAQENESKLKGIDLSKIELRQAFESHVMFKVGKQADMQKIANNLKTRKEVLAVEWLDKKKVFGDKASIDEMSAFKSKVKK